MWKVAVVQPVTEGFGFNITTETNVQLVSFAYRREPKPRRPQPMLRRSSRKPFRCFQSSTRTLSADGGPFYWICGTDETRLRPELGRGHQLRPPMGDRQ